MRSFEIVFTSNSGETPETPHKNTGFNDPVPPWTDEIPRLTTEKNSLWQSSRSITGAPNVGDPIYSDWTPPILIGTKIGEREWQI